EVDAGLAHQVGRGLGLAETALPFARACDERLDVVDVRACKPACASRFEMAERPDDAGSAEIEREKWRCLAVVGIERVDRPIAVRREPRLDIGDDRLDACAGASIVPRARIERFMA